MGDLLLVHPVKELETKERLDTAFRIEPSIGIPARPYQKKSGISSTTVPE
jgi:hypothetical protein